MLAGKASAYESEALYGCSTLWLASGLTCKHETKQEWLARDKHSSFLLTLINYEFKMFCNIDLRATFGHVTYDNGYVYPMNIQILGYFITGCTVIWIPVTID
jgi:hypothetical protein